MELLYNSKLINQIVDKLFKHRRTDYSEFNLDNIIYMSDLEQETFKVYNQNYQKLHVSLFKKCSQPSICILFMHGYGSNRLQCCNLLKSLEQNYAICSFDFSGSGKSEGDLITYGMKEKEDIKIALSIIQNRLGIRNS